MATRKEGKPDQRLRRLLETGRWREDELLWLLKQPGLSSELLARIRWRLAEIRATTGAEASP
jgi:hypothetical protein